jgi:hypothetical protein
MPTGMSRRASRNAAIKPRTEPTIIKTPEHQTLQTPTGLPVGGLRNWNLATKPRPGLTLALPTAGSTSASSGSPFVVHRAGTVASIPGPLLTLAPSPAHVEELRFPRPESGAANSGSGQTGANGATTAEARFPGPESGADNSGPGFHSGANSTPTAMSVSQPANMANEQPATAMPTSMPRNGVNEQGTSETAPGVQFRQNRRIQGSDQWVDSDYDVFRNYRSEWHDRDWWRTHQSRIVFCAGGWYYWNAGYWFPAWGYDPAADYAYDGPIYAYKDWPPDQVTADVQGTLQNKGYYRGETNGFLGSSTEAALANFQRDHGLYQTSTIDLPTSHSLGMK